MKKGKTKEEKIDKNMSFAEIMQKHPETAEILMSRGMHCIGCPMAMQEKLSDGAIAHGLDPDKLTEEINEKLKKNR